MKKEVIITIIVLFAIYGGVSIYLLTSIPQLFLSPPLATPPIPQNCSTENIQNVWDATFKISPNINVKNQTSNSDRCDEYIAYSNQSTKLYIIHGTDDGTTAKTTAKYIEFEQNYFDNIIFPNLTNGKLSEIVTIITSPTNLTLRSLITLGDAENHYNSIFQYSPTNMQKQTSGNLTLFIFSATESNNTETRKIDGLIHANYTLTTTDYEIQIGGCTPNWVANNTNCTSSETYITYYTDSNNCGDISNLPANETNDCDYDDNGIIGDEDDITDTNLDLELYISNEELNLSEIYNTTKTIKLKEGSTTRVSFEYDFSSPLNLKQIVVKKQPSTFNYGYLIVSGINVEKTVRVDKKNSSTNKVCIEDKTTSSISSISTNCDSADETLLSCPDTSGGFSCSISSNLFVIIGLEHSAVEEFTGSNATTPTCTTNWICTSWSACIDNQQTRTCTDQNSCNTTSGKPAETQSCGSTCSPLWDCTSWTPDPCPSNKTQTRDCTDLNNCQADKTETRTCEYKSKTLIIILVIIGVLIAGALITLFLIMRKGGQSSSYSSNLPPPTIIQQPPPGQQQDPFTYQQAPSPSY